MKIVIAFALMVLGAGAYLFMENERLSTGAYDAAGDPEIWVFTYNTCGLPCIKAFDELKRRGLEYREIELDPDKRESKEYAIWRSKNVREFPLIMIGPVYGAGSSNGQISSVLGKGLGLEHLSWDERKFYAEHFNEDNTPRIVLYCTEVNPDCKRLKRQFADTNTAYLNIEVEKPKRNDLLLKTLEIDKYPAVWVGFTRVKGINANDAFAVLEAY